MASRPNIHARNSSGKQVSLLNDEFALVQESRPVLGAPPYTSMARSNSNTSRVSTVSSPRTPGLLRSDSYDSQTTNDPVSPITPVSMIDYGRRSSYTSAGYYKSAAHQYEERTYEYPPPNPTTQQYTMPVRHAYPDRTPFYAEAQYEEDSYMNQSSDRETKRYPCRYRDSHHCEKTFTTSGHASRHSKIHTAEKAVQCTYQGCQKKFTRADNMKQHLDTHYKSKSGPSQKSSSSKSALTAPAGIRKSAPPSRLSRPPSRNLGQAEYAPYDPALDAGSNERYPHATHAASPIAPYGTLEMQNALMSRPMVARMESSSAGLDVLANIAALQSWPPQS
jgi:hypothetical protein